jgi:hypothetical protein
VGMIYQIDMRVKGLEDPPPQISPGVQQFAGVQRFAPGCGEGCRRAAGGGPGDTPTRYAWRAPARRVNIAAGRPRARAVVWRGCRIEVPRVILSVEDRVRATGSFRGKPHAGAPSAMGLKIAAGRPAARRPPGYLRENSEVRASCIGGGRSERRSGGHAALGLSSGAFSILRQSVGAPGRQPWVVRQRG